VKNFTRTIIATACIVTSFNVLAHENYKGDFKGEAMPLMPVTIPVLQGGLDFTLGGLYLKPTSSNVEYVSSSLATTVGSVITVNNEIESVHPDYTWGFLLGIGYIFPNTANDVRVNWMHLHDDGNDDDSSFSALGSVITPISGLPSTALDTGDVATAEGEAVYDFDAVDLTFGQYINIGRRLQTRLFTGLRWARLNNELSANYSYPVTADDFNFANQSVESDSTFNGIGPIFGIEANYMVGYNIGISGYVDAALLVGKISFDPSTHLSGFDDGDFIENVNRNFDHDNLSVVAPAWDARLGLNYTYFMGNGSAFRFEIGYQVSKYIDVIETADFPGFALSSTTVTPGTSTINFGLNGLYLQGSLKI
jgi:hypothetical protein